MSFDKFTHLCTYHPNQNRDRFPSLQKVGISVGPSESNPPPPSPRQPRICFLSPQIPLGSSRAPYKWNHIFCFVFIFLF